MKTQQRKLTQGFTIIEVLIVLAIAGLILAIVFLAVPALQRNTRNNGRINDVARVGASVNNWVSNNNGLVFGGTTAATKTAAEKTVINDVGNLSQYTLTADTTLSTLAAPQSAMTTLANIVIVTGGTCDNSASPVQGKVIAAGTNQLALQYATESGTATPIAQCLNI